MPDTASEPRRRRLVLEIDADILDPEWTERDLIVNAATYFDIIIRDAEKREEERFEPSYRIITDDLSLYYVDDYMAEIAKAEGLATLAALPAEERTAMWDFIPASEEDS